MTLSEFKHLIEAYGADANKWPADLKEAALNFRANHPEDTELFMQEAVKLDAVLDTINVAPPGDRLKNRTLRALPPQQDSLPRNNIRSPGWGRIAAMVMVAFGLGFGGAQYLSMPGSADHQADFVASLDQTNWLDTAEDLGVSDVYYWVQGEDPVITVSDI